MVWRRSPDKISLMQLNEEKKPLTTPIIFQLKSNYLINEIEIKNSLFVCKELRENENNEVR